MKRMLTVQLMRNNRAVDEKDIQKLIKQSENQRVGVDEVFYSLSMYTKRKEQA